MTRERPPRHPRELRSRSFLTKELRVKRYRGATISSALVLLELLELPLEK